ncbi:MAG TPA: OmpH family outer membrane protein [Polyangiaceae bacterium]|nr:OmpH family outer membrane protein [Polyangiaceae bacterium]
MRSLPLRPLALGLAAFAAASLLRPALAADPAPAGGVGPRIAIIDMQRAVIETEDGLRAQAALRKYVDRRQSELNARQEELVRKKDELEKQAKVLSKEALQRATEEWQRQAVGLQGVLQDSNQELQRRQNDVLAPVYGRVAGLVRKIARNEGFDLIVERQAVPYVRAELDLTDRVILLYNAGETPGPDEAGPPIVPAPPLTPGALPGAVPGPGAPRVAPGAAPGTVPGTAPAPGAAPKPPR